MKYNILKMNVIHFLLAFHFFSAVLIPFFTDWGHLNYKQIFFLQSWFVFWTFALEVPTGAIADRFGRKLSMILACFVNATATIVYASIPNFYIFMMGEFLWALAVSLLSGASQALIYDTLKTFRKINSSQKVFARYYIMGTLAFVIAAPLGSFIASATDLRMPLLLTSIPMFVAGLIALTLEEPRLGRIKRLGYVDAIKLGVGFFRKHKILKILAIDMTIVNMITYFILWFYQIMLRNAGVDILYFGVVATGMNIFAIIMMNNIERLKRWFGVRGLLFLSTMIPGIGFFIAGLTNFLPLIILIIFLIMASRQIRDPIFQHHMNKYIPSSKRATILSSISMIKMLGILLVNPLIGVLSDWSVNYTLMIIGIVGIVFAFKSRVREIVF